VGWDGDEYQRRFDALAAAGVDVHGEATFVRSFSPATVLDAGCGTGRVAVELARHGLTVVGVDVDPSMLATARRASADVEWVEADLCSLSLGGRTFDVVVMAGNVPLFTPPGTQPALVAAVARHVRPGGTLVAGFSLGRGYEVADYDRDCAAAAGGLRLAGRFSTWDRKPYVAGESDYAVSVHVRDD
jgi:ubiquinone/menaquinone biosynthesis C-methylase UbiE